MKLTDLEAEFLRWEKRFEGVPYIKPAGGEFGDPFERVVHVSVPTLAEAQGVQFLCPKCYAENGGARGVHLVVCWSRSRGVPDEATPGPGRWTLVGTGLHDLTLNGDPPGAARSVLLTSGCGWHGFVTNGEAA